MNLYKILGASKESTDEELKKLYRDKSKQFHPDVGGDAEMFKQIALAYQILSDPEKRKRYDSGESADSIGKAGVSIEVHILRQLVELFTNVVLATDPKYTNIVDHMRNHLNNNIAQVGQAIRNEQTKNDLPNSGVSIVTTYYQSYFHKFIYPLPIKNESILYYRSKNSFSFLVFNFR